VGDRKASHSKATHPTTQWGYISVAYIKFLDVFQKLDFNSASYR